MEEACKWSIAKMLGLKDSYSSNTQIDDCSAEKLKVSYASHLKNNFLVKMHDCIEFVVTTLIVIDNFCFR